MIAGLTNLNVLKGHLLASSMQDDTTFDQTLQIIGMGIAGMFNSFCNRRLQWMTGDTITFSGDRPHYYLPRYPILSVTSIQMRYFLADPWADITDQPISVNFETGMIHFGYTLGRFPLQVKAVWNGGYWFEPLEPDDAAYPSTAPAGATLLPDDLRAAFLLMADTIWDQQDKLGTNLVATPGDKSSMMSLDFPPMIRQILQPYIRYQLS